MSSRRTSCSRRKKIDGAWIAPWKSMRLPFVLRRCRSDERGRGRAATLEQRDRAHAALRLFERQRPRGNHPRGVLDPLDPATKKSLLEFGASPQLIATLESGTTLSRFRGQKGKAERGRCCRAPRSARTGPETQPAQPAQTQRPAPGSRGADRSIRCRTCATSSSSAGTARSAGRTTPDSRTRN